METQTIPYWRKPYGVQAVRITPENIYKLAEEINGECQELGDCWDSPVQYISFGGIKGFTGDWVVATEDSFRFYTHEEFSKKFRTLSEELSQNEKFARVFGMVMSAMSKQDAATYHGYAGGMDFVAADITREILAVL